MPGLTPVNQGTPKPANMNPAYKPPLRERTNTQDPSYGNIAGGELLRPVKRRMTTSGPPATPKARGRNAKKKQNGRSLSQLSTPPGSEKRGEKLIRAFASSDDIEHGFSSTVLQIEPKVHLGLAKTTMQKLAAFRYQPSEKMPLIRPEDVERVDQPSNNNGKPARTSGFGQQDDNLASLFQDEVQQPENLVLGSIHDNLDDDFDDLLGESDDPFPDSFIPYQELCQRDTKEANASGKPNETSQQIRSTVDIPDLGKGQAIPNHQEIPPATGAHGNTSSVLGFQPLGLTHHDDFCDESMFDNATAVGFDLWLNFEDTLIGVTPTTLKLTAVHHSNPKDLSSAPTTARTDGKTNVSVKATTHCNLGKADTNQDSSKLNSMKGPAQNNVTTQLIQRQSNTNNNMPYQSVDDDYDYDAAFGSEAVTSADLVAASNTGPMPTQELPGKQDDFDYDADFGDEAVTAEDLVEHTKELSAKPTLSHEDEYDYDAEFGPGGVTEDDFLDIGPDEELIKDPKVNAETVEETRLPPSSILQCDEDHRDMQIYDKKLRHSPVGAKQSSDASQTGEVQIAGTQYLAEPEDWAFLGQWERTNKSREKTGVVTVAATQSPAVIQPSAATEDEYSPLAPFARRPFPDKVLDRSPVTGISPSIVLRTCFRIGEALNQGNICTRANQDAMIEMFARVTFSSRDTDARKQQFQFGDIFHGKPPFLTGVLDYAGCSNLIKTESYELVTVGKETKSIGGVGEMVRVLGRLKRVVTGKGWTMEILNVRKSDWEEVRWTKRIASAYGY